MKNSITYILRTILYRALSVLNFITPKSKNKIFLFDDVFRKDNMWALYKYMIRNNYNEEYKIIYFINDLNKVEGKHRNVFLINNSLIGAYHQLTSEFVFWGYGTNRFTCRAVNNQKRIELWHGSPLKTIGYLAGNKPWYEYKKSYTYLLCASQLFRSIMQRCFNFDEEQGLILGAPRNDYLFSQKDCFSLLDINTGNYSKIILWMPTFRKSTRHNMSDSSCDFPILNDSNIEKINIDLKSKKALVIIKPHPLHGELDFLYKEFSNIKIILNEELEKANVELYELLGNVDALITDYSSVYFDFLLTQKPIGFVLDDLEEYGDKRGFVVENPIELMPGQKIYNKEELLSFIDNLINNKDEYKEERKRINDLVNKYQDDKNCERILEFLGITLKNSVKIR